MSHRGFACGVAGRATGNLEVLGMEEGRMIDGVGVVGNLREIRAEAESLFTRDRMRVMSKDTSEAGSYSSNKRMTHKHRK